VRTCRLDDNQRLGPFPKVRQQLARLLIGAMAHRVVTAELIEELFGLAARVITDPVYGCPVVLPGQG